MVTGFSSITPGNSWQTNGVKELTYPEDFLKIRPKCSPPDRPVVPRVSEMVDLGMPRMNESTRLDHNERLARIFHDGNEHLKLALPHFWLTREF